MADTASTAPAKPVGGGLHDAMAAAKDGGDVRGLSLILLVSVFVVATCGLIYELLAGTIATYLLGDSVTQFSTVIGTYLFAMGIGSWFSRYIDGRLLAWFIRIEIIIALVGGTSAAALFLLFPVVDDFRPILYGLVLLVGFLVGLEIPLLIRILKDEFSFGELVSNVLTYDYIGALAASLLFPLVLVPFVGLIRGGFVIGFVNILVALLLVWRLRKNRSLLPERIAAVAVAAILVAGAISSERLQRASEAGIYNDNLIHATSSNYQRIVLTQDRGDIRLFLDGNLQFSSRDEYRYHESLVWPALARAASPRRVLIMGGGDGLALREVLRETAVERAVLVDLDPAITQLFSTAPALKRLNDHAFDDPRVEVINADAFTWSRDADRRFDVILVDLPDPTNYSIGRLYSVEFYRNLGALLAPGGVMSVQSTAPYVATRSFRMIGLTLAEAGFTIQPYHAYVPSFGDWGFTLAARAPIGNVGELPRHLRYYSAAEDKRMQQFPADMQAEVGIVNRLENQALVRMFMLEWRAFGDD
ncbi:MAG: polyamine aminopropyltransferase [Erythrobacter sp.]|jgi:spermidine synthase|nr:polyamine aminopropyltransferase [Erythrobacter sp.]